MMTEETKTGPNADTGADEDCCDSWSGFGQPFGDLKGMVEEVIDGVRDLPTLMAVGGPRLEMIQTPDAYEYYLDLPGVDRSDLEVSARGSTLIVTGVRHAPEVPDNGSRIRSERGNGSFRRTLRVPSDGDTGQVRARLKKGVLRIRVARVSEEEATTIDLED